MMVVLAGAGAVPGYGILKSLSFRIKWEGAAEKARKEMSVIS